MAFQSVAILLFLAAIKANVFNLAFVEKGTEYNETIIVDKRNGIVEYDVPKHADLAAAKYFTDFNVGLTIMKVPDMKKCFAMKIPEGEPTPAAVEVGFKNLHGKFPQQRYMVENLNVLPVGELHPRQLSPAIVSFCGNLPVVHVKQYTVDQMEKKVVNALKAKPFGRRRRNVIIDFKLCEQQSQNHIRKCPTNRLAAKCRFVVLGTCVFVTPCEPSQNGWVCPNPVHRYTSVNCCDYYCKSF